MSVGWHKHMVRVAAVTACIVWAGTSVTGADGGRVEAKVVRLVGIARFTPDERNWEPLKLGQSVALGSIIQPAAEVDVQFSPTPGGKLEPGVVFGTVRLYANSAVRLSKPRVEAGGRRSRSK